jgi:hypothetical protein
MTGKNYIPADYDRITVVGDLCSLLSEDFGTRGNVVLYPRRLAGDFDALARVMAAYFNLGKDEIFIKYKENEKLLAFRDVLENENLLRCLDIILADMEFIQSTGARTTLRLLRGYSEASGTHEFHVDGLNQNFDRMFTCYNDPVTEYVRNDDVLSVDGHKAVVRDDAVIYSFHAGDIWKQRVRNKKEQSLLGVLKGVMEDKAKRAFVHRAQRSKHPRLMLVGDLSVDV